MGKGILLEMAGREAVVLTPQGEFRKVPVPRGTWDIGDEIEYAEVRQQPVWLRWGTAAAAAAVLLVGSYAGFNEIALRQPVAVVTVDINPSLELTLNKADQVLKAEPLNKDGELVLKGVDFKRKPLDEVLVKLTDRAVEEQKLNPADESSAVVVGVAPAKQNDLPPAQVERVVEKAKAAVTNEVAKVASAKGEAPKTSVAVLAASAAEKKQAETEGLSVGKYMLWTEIKATVPEVTKDEIKDLGPGKALKNHGISPSDVLNRAEKKNEESKGSDKAQPANAKPQEQGGEKKDDPAGKADDKNKGQEKKDDESKKSSGAQQTGQPGAEKKDDPKQVEVKQDKTQQGESKQDQSPGQSKKDEPKQAEPKKENANPAKPNKDEPKQDGGKKNSWTIPWLGITIEKPAFLRDKEDAQPAAAAEAPAVTTPRAEEPGAGVPSEQPKREEPKQDEPKQKDEKKSEEGKPAEEKKSDEVKPAEEKQSEAAKPAEEQKSEEKKAEEKKAEESKQDEKPKSEKDKDKGTGKDKDKGKGN